ncbi:hypothetical protein JNUCC64_02865 [Streptomyces sp. JNUCC 64]
MSFWMRLAKVSPVLLPDLRERPDALLDLFSDEEGAAPPAGFDRDEDSLEYQFFPGEETVDHDHWLTTAHRIGEEIGHDSDGGGFFAVGPDGVRAVARAAGGDELVRTFLASAAAEGKAVVGALL